MLGLAWPKAFAQQPISLSKANTKPVVTRILFLLDASGSMETRWETGTRMTAAKGLLTKMIDSLVKLNNVEVGLRVYGHQATRSDQDCTDTRLEVPFSKGNGAALKQKLVEIKSRGNTPIAYSLQQSAGDFPIADRYSRNIIILITDGLESCKGDPCAVALALQAKHVSFKPFIIGLGMDVKVKDAFECMGTYYNAAKEKEFKAIMNQVVAQALNNTTAQISLMDAAGKPKETNMPISLYDARTGQLVHDFIHTLNTSLQPDTLLLDPAVTYNMTVHTLPPIERKNIKLMPGKHNTIAMNAPQGNLLVAVEGSPNRVIKVVVRKHSEGPMLDAYDINRTKRLLAGHYDVELLTVPRIRFDNVDVAGGATVKRQIQTPGLANFMFDVSGYSFILQTVGGIDERIYDFEPGDNVEIVQMQPGTYKLVFRAKEGHSTAICVVRTFTVESGRTVTVRM